MTTPPAPMPPSAGGEPGESGPAVGGRSTLSAADVDTVRQRLAIAASRIDLCDLPDAGPVVIKRQRSPRGPWRARGMAALARVTGLDLLRPVPMHGGARGEAIELARIGTLGRAGVRVPEVLHAEPGFFVMRRLVGANLAERIEAGSDAGFAAWLRGLDTIADVHQRGLCLSQAFARNLIETPAGIACIDFEDDPLETLPLETAQARDWLAYLHSTAWLLDAPHGSARTAIDGALGREKSGVRERLLAAGHSLAVFQRLPASRRPLGREVLGLGALARLLA